MSGLLLCGCSMNNSFFHFILFKKKTTRTKIYRQTIIHARRCRQRQKSGKNESKELYVIWHKTDSQIKSSKNFCYLNFSLHMHDTYALRIWSVVGWAYHIMHSVAPLPLRRDSNWRWAFSTLLNCTFYQNKRNRPNFAFRLKKTYIIFVCV